MRFLKGAKPVVESDLSAAEILKLSWPVKPPAWDANDNDHAVYLVQCYLNGMVVGSSDSHDRRLLLTLRRDLNFLRSDVLTDRTTTDPSTLAGTAAEGMPSEREAR